MALTGQSPGQARAPKVAEPKAHYGIRPFPKRGNIVTNEQVDKLREGDAY